MARAHLLKCFVVLLQLDGGVTFTEPTAIICGQVEGKSDVSHIPSLLLCGMCASVDSQSRQAQCW